MLFNVGVEPPEEDGTYHIVIPVFYPLFVESMAKTDKYENIATVAKDAILAAAEKSVFAKFAKKPLDFQFNAYDADHPQCNKWFVLEVPVEHLFAKQKSVNVNLSDSLINCIDTHIEGSNLYNDRSDFLTKVSREKLTKIKTNPYVKLITDDLSDIVVTDPYSPLSQFIEHLYTRGEKEFNISFYDLIMASEGNITQHIQLIIEAISDNGSPDFLESLYSLIKEARKEPALVRNGTRASSHFKPEPEPYYQIPSNKQIIVGWDRSGVGTTTLTNLLQASGFNVKEFENDKSYPYRILPVSDMKDVAALMNLESDDEPRSEFEGILDKEGSNLRSLMIVLTNCDHETEVKIKKRLADFDIKPCGVLPSHTDFADCKDGATKESLTFATKNLHYQNMVSMISKRILY